MSKSKMSRPEKRERRLNNSALKKAVNEVAKEKKHKDYTSVYWQAVRVAVFNRDNYTCKTCGSQKDLRCHHIMYSGDRASWDYDLCVYETLCSDCHNEFHKVTQGKNLVVTKRFYIDYISKNRQGRADFSKLPKPKKLQKSKFKHKVKPVKKAEPLEKRFAKADAKAERSFKYSYKTRG